MRTKITILILSIIYCGYLLTLLAAGHYNSNALNPLNSEYYYQNGLLTQAIETEPSKAIYHMYYGLELLKTLPENKFSAQNQLRLAKKEFFRAAQLKSYNELYKKTYDTYVTWIDRQL
jgi:hypothetical protein